MSIYEILPALDLTQSVHAKISIGMHREVKFKISRIPLIGLETRLGWRTDRKFLWNPNLVEIREDRNHVEIWLPKKFSTLLQEIGKCCACPRASYLKKVIYVRTKSYLSCFFLNIWYLQTQLLVHECKGGFFFKVLRLDQWQRSLYIIEITCFMVYCMIS